MGLVRYDTLEAIPREVVICQRDDGIEPFSDWLKSLVPLTRARVRNRIDHVEAGNLGEHKGVGGGVVELILDFGPGYRVYIGQIGTEVHLISGGAKGTQDRDIKDAQDFWASHD
ncbi:MAG: type II toxin-antitoxin system RelE/ParE family toxin [Terriglobales bacterium]